MTAAAIPLELDVVTNGGASCAMYRAAPSWNGRRTAAIGKFSCVSTEAGAALLGQVVDRLRGEKFSAVIGPMDGDTWHAYRVVSESDQSPPFFIEPVSGNCDAAAFTAAGFTAISSYVSARATIDDAIGVPAPAVAGVAIEAWDGGNADRLIGGLFDLSRHAFADNAFYKPITRDAFLQLYQPVLPAIDPRLVFFAHKEGALVGYLFAIPDRLQGPRPTTAIIKMYTSTVRGVGHQLLDTAHRTLRDHGYATVIHALMHVDNQSRARSSRHSGEVFRRYDLMGRAL